MFQKSVYTIFLQKENNASVNVLLILLVPDFPDITANKLFERLKSL